jgi:hypothetical protein
VTVASTFVPFFCISAGKTFSPMVFEMTSSVA